MVSPNSSGINPSPEQNFGMFNEILDNVHFQNSVDFARALIDGNVVGIFFKLG